MRTMIIGCAICLTASLALGAPTTQPSAERENAALKQRVSSLEAEVAALREQVKMLQTPRLSVGTLKPMAPRFDLGSGQLNVLGSQPGGAALPPGWVPQQFNGQPHYLVPLSGGTLKLSGNNAERIISGTGTISKATTAPRPATESVGAK
jgi:hypothetical protein